MKRESKVIMKRLLCILCIVGCLFTSSATCMAALGLCFCILFGSTMMGYAATTYNPTNDETYTKGDNTLYIELSGLYARGRFTYKKPSSTTKIAIRLSVVENCISGGTIKTRHGRYDYNYKYNSSYVYSKIEGKDDGYSIYSASAKGYVDSSKTIELGPVKYY